MSSYVTVSTAFAVSLVAFKVINIEILTFMVLIIGCVLGFMVVNFPLGEYFWAMVGLTL